MSLAYCLIPDHYNSQKLDARGILGELAKMWQTSLPNWADGYSNRRFVMEDVIEAIICSLFS